MNIKWHRQVKFLVKPRENVSAVEWLCRMMLRAEGKGERRGVVFYRWGLRSQKQAVWRSSGSAGQWPNNQGRHETKTRPGCAALAIPSPCHSHHDQLFFWLSVQHYVTNSGVYRRCWHDGYYMAYSRISREVEMAIFIGSSPILFPLV